MAAFEEDLVECAVNAMNEVFGAEFKKDNLVVCFHDPDQDVRDAFMQRHGFEVEGTGEDGIAEAFCYGKDGKDGILICRMADEGQIFHTLLHELSHIFCIHNEIEGGHFFDRYCMGERSIEDGTINAGYAIWREIIAEVMAKEISPDMKSRKLDKSMQREIDHYRKVTSPLNPADKYALSNMIDTIMCMDEVKGGISWTDLEAKLTALDTPYMSVVELAFSQLRNDKPYEISADFIMELGNAFLVAKAARLVKELN